MLKRDLHLFLRCLIPAAVFAAALAAVCAVAAAAVAQGAEKVYTPAKAAVVDGEDTVLSRMLIHGVAEVDYIKQLLDIELCDAEEAMAGLESEEYAAVIELPEDFIHDILSGAEKQGRITLSPAAVSNSDVIEGVAAFGELLLASGQYAAFGSQTVIDRYISDGDQAGQILDRVNVALLGEVMNAGDAYFTLTVTDYAGSGVSLSVHYAVSWLALLLALSAVMFERLYLSDRDRSMLLRLNGAGVTDGRFLFWKLVLPFFFLFGVLLIALAVLGRWFGVVWNDTAVLCAAAAAAVPAVMAAAFLICMKKGSPALMISGVLGLFLCGGIVPRQMLHPLMLKAGDLTPLGVSRGLLAPVFGGELSPWAVAAAAVWCIAGTAAMVLSLRRLRLKGGAQ